MTNFEMDATNSMIITHYESDEYDHIIHRKEQAGMVVAHYIFRGQMDNFDDIAKQLMDVKCTTLITGEPSEATLEKFEEFVASLLPKTDTFPEAWCEA